MFNHKNPLEDGGEDTISIKTIIDPDHKVITPPGAYYALNEEHDWCGIDSPEYIKRFNEYYKNISKKPEATTDGDEGSSQDSI